jgi:hypothetical protein
VTGKLSLKQPLLNKKNLIQTQNTPKKVLQNSHLGINHSLIQNSAKKILGLNQYFFRQNLLNQFFFGTSSITYGEAKCSFSLLRHTKFHLGRKQQ